LTGGDLMAVLVRMTVAGMDAATYDQASTQLGPLIKKQPGFIMHVAYPSPGGFTVGEIWESRGQYDTWFNGNVKPNVPGEIKQEVIELHGVVQP
jgi:heme-degrading monooxygenase HmoA